MKKNFIVVIDGADGSGKTTQLELLKKKFTEFNFTKFPDYESETGFYITKYLNGAFSFVIWNENRYEPY